MKTRGADDVCRMLVDAARARAFPLDGDTAMDWAISIGAHVAAALPAPSADPCAALDAYLQQMGVPDADRRIALPGSPCDSCVAAQITPLRVAAEVVHLADLLGVSPSKACLWTSRIGAIVLAHVAVDYARNPHDALAALVLGEYAGVWRRIDCDRAKAP